jgi:putative membrane protein
MTTFGLLTSCWQLDPLALAVIVAGLAAYVATRRSRSTAQAFFFGASLVLLGVALLSPVGSLAQGYLFSAHMLQHLLLVLVVPPLALMGFGLAPAGKTPASHRPRLPLLVAWGLGVGAMWLWHAPTLCDAAARSVSFHRLQEASLLGMGTAFWWPVLAPRASARLSPFAGMLYLFTACTACTLLGIYITFSPVEVCSVFAHPVDRLGVMPLVRNGWGLSAETDQQVGGLLMWVPACLVYGVGILGLLARMYRESEEPGLETEEAS